MCGLGPFMAEAVAWQIAAADTLPDEPLLRLRRAAWGERRAVAPLLRRAGLDALPRRHLLAEAPDGALMAGLFLTGGRAVFAGADRARIRLARAAVEAFGLTMQDADPAVPTVAAERPHAVPG
jgi:hypothetical protein